MANGSTPITFVVPVGLLAGSDGPLATRGAALSPLAGANGLVQATAIPGEDVVELTLANGPTLVLHPENARDLMLSQRGGQARGAAPFAGEGVLVDPNLGWPGLDAAAGGVATRGWLKQAVLTAFKIVTGVARDPAVSLVQSLAVRKVDGAVVEGVYPLTAAALPAALKGSDIQRLDAVPDANGKPILVLVHGTFVDTVSTFGKLWQQHPAKVATLIAAYGGRVVALDHPTMSESPIANALALVKTLPPRSCLHLVTHSRGGLVAEVLARACGAGKLDARELAFFDEPRYAKHRADLQQLVQMAQDKQLTVARVVRVACPARGTTLASGRLDAYLSVLHWALGLAGWTVSAELVDFLHEVARRRADPTELPGIEAMMPESAVIRWLDDTAVAIPGDLRVVAGDLQGGDSIGSWVKTLLADAFYWTDNDLVVQTRSMYGGVPRAPGADAAQPSARFLLDRGAGVTHFTYFSNDKTVDAIIAALTTDAPAGFEAIGPLSWQGQSTLGTRAALAASPDGTRPAVFVLPGILGSNLALGGKRVWLGLRIVDGLSSLAWEAAPAAPGAGVLPDGVIEGSYGALIARLAETHDVIPFPFDWRVPMEVEAARLAGSVDAALAARATSQQPVRIVAHSMGGLVARTMQLVSPNTWANMMARNGARMLMLGVPNAGSWAPMQILSGDDTFGNALAAFGSLLRDGRARAIMAGMPGLMQLQAGLLDPARSLSDTAEWSKLIAADKAALQERLIWHDPGNVKAIYDWSAPGQDVLDFAAKLRRRLDAQVDVLRADQSRMMLVVGRAPFTPTGVDVGPDGMDYLGTADSGDGRVTHESAMQLGVPTWRIDAHHGDLASTASAFAAYVELLQTGTTALIDRFDTLARGAVPPSAAATMRMRPMRGLLSSLPPSRDADVFGMSTDAVETPPARLELAVLNADLRFVSDPLLIGHYSSLRLTGAEHVVDQLIDHGMSRALQAGIYPDAVGAHRIFGNDRPDPGNPAAMARPTAVAVCGLGDEGKLDTAKLVFTVRQAVLGCAQWLADRGPDAPATFDLCATLIGSGGTGISVGGAAQAVAQGAFEACQKIAADRWPQLRRVTLVELYLDRAAEAWRALQMQQAALPGRFELAGRVGFGPGAMRRTPDTSYRGTGYDFIRAFMTPGTDAANPEIGYTLDTRRARTEIRAQRMQGLLLREMIAQASDSPGSDAQIGRTLFSLLVPAELEPFLGGATSVVLELELATAGIPWELLDTDPSHDGGDERPWAIRSKLMRKLELRAVDVRKRDTSPDDNILVLGEPLCDPTQFPRLPGARREAVAVADQLLAALGPARRDNVVSLVDQPNANAVVNALFKRRYRIVHIAGHGMPAQPAVPATPGVPGMPAVQGGVVLSGGAFLGVNEVNAMRAVPELVFLNCCYLATTDASGVLADQRDALRYDRAEFAASMAEALVNIGVRCVIAAGWAVEDGPAETFASTFYASFLGGNRFADAVANAREAAWKANKSGVTWAAYQCYGDPDWCWQTETRDAQRPSAPSGAELANIASPISLASALEAIATEKEYGSADTSATLALRLGALEDAFGDAWGDIGAVAEAFGVAYGALSALEPAIGWYRRAVGAEDGSASFRAAEQLGNLLARHGAKQRDVALVTEGIERLGRLAALRGTFERMNLLGSAWKRLSQVQSDAGDTSAALAALDSSIDHYRQASAACGEAAERFYPLKAWIGADIRRALVSRRRPAIDEARLGDLRDALNVAARDKPDFWSVVGQSELVILRAVLHGRLALDLVPLLPTLRRLKTRVPAVLKWSSVLNESRFVLQPYIDLAATPAAESEAATRLLALLAGFADVGGGAA